MSDDIINIGGYCREVNEDELNFKTNNMSSEKIELRHLAPYLPYDVSIKDTRSETGNVYKLHTQNIWSAVRFSDTQKLILRPLSDLYDLEEFTHVYANESDCESIEQWVNLDPESRIGTNWSYVFWCNLFENHFDVFGLIDKGLAIDINSLD